MNLPSRGEVEPLTKRLKMDCSFFNSVRDSDSITKVQVRFRKNDYEPHSFPKSVLLAHINKHHLPDMPVYRTEGVDKLFYSTVTLDGKQYAADYL